MPESETKGLADLLRGFRTAIQVGVVVRDLEKSMKELTALFGIGPFRVVDCPPVGRESQQFLNGRLVRFRTRQAFADMGSVELELIQPVEGDTIWSAFMAAHGPGISVSSGSTTGARPPRPAPPGPCPATRTPPRASAACTRAPAPRVRARA